MAKKILIIEDVDYLQKAMEMSLKDAGYETLAASDGKAGLNTALSEHPDLILLDIMLPKMNGIEVLRKLRKDRWGKKVPVIILTNQSSEEKLIEASKLNVSDYYVKSDWDVGELPDLVEDKLN